MEISAAVWALWLGKDYVFLLIFLLLIRVDG